MRRPSWYVRPGDDVINPRTGRPYARNHAVPRIAWHLQHAHTLTEESVYQAVDRRSRAVKSGGGRKVRSVSTAQLAREVKLPESTVRDALRSLARKHSLVQWNEDRGTAQPRKRGDFGGVTTWMIPPYTEALPVRRADPEIGTVNGNCYVIGKGRRFLTPFEVIAWKVDAKVAENAGVLAAARGTAENEIGAPVAVSSPGGEQTQPTAARAAESSSPPGAATSPPGFIDPLPKRIREALHATVVQKNFSDTTAKSLVKRARALAADRGQRLSDEEIEQAIYAAWQNAGKRVKVIGFYDRALPEKIEALIEARARDADARADEALILATKCPRCRGRGRDPIMVQEDCRECGGTGQPKSNPQTAVAS